MEKFSHFRAIGNATEKEKEEAIEELSSFLDKNNSIDSNGEKITELRAKERPKSPEELYLIDLANKETNKLMEDLGFQSFDIPRENFFMLPEDAYNQYGDHGGALTNYESQIILLNADANSEHLVMSALTLFHETFHLKAAQVIQVSKTENEPESEFEKNHYKIGWTTHSPAIKNKENTAHSHFSGLHEAIVANEEFKFLKRIMDIEFFSEFKKEMESDMVAMDRKEISESQKIPIDELYLINLENRKYLSIVYSNQRKVLLYVCSEISKDTGIQEEDMQKEFLRAHFSGSFSKLARIIEDAFGEGGFRELGNLGTDRDLAVNTLESLKKFRLRELKNRKIEVKK